MSMTTIDRHPVSPRQRSNGPCWEWYGASFPNGRPKLNGRYAYRVIYEKLTGTPLDGLDLHHRCENPQCVNPWHMEPLTKAEHSARHGRAVSGYMPPVCPEGHEYTEQNTYTWTDPKNGKTERHCRVCRREQWRAKNGTTGRVNKTKRNPAQTP